ncbi:bifunctional lysylphosphatidylglycerol synthetase/lysine--tRNA ligase LysX [Arthrobacter mangrovi]|uniref:Lysylphosphatidylglycerol biosynthesis bifunctional protein LysX n=1 Tax=Arthrobacter mangrovi TaxID=2966350 RepID=A0ABQ5MXY0_9MICC|nr:bifunctional lysylphosphatidylglycerol synthetase/lysine--tRNA ligase LysX [Arthrobacter mangrovi]GLB68813.1 lysylphosphatidylglycerol biosynthesis bifunctional protein LysX [Arthrobacter mangrovi]
MGRSISPNRSGGHRHRRTAPTPAQERWARILTWLYAVATLTAVVLWLARLAGLPSRLPVVVFGALNIPLTPSLVSIVVLALVTGALLRRRRVALMLLAVFAVLGLIVSAAILAGLWERRPGSRPAAALAAGTAVELIGIVASLLTLWLVWWVRPAFPARTRAGAARAAILTLVGGTVLSVGLPHVLLRAGTGPAVDGLDVLGMAVLRALGLRVAPAFYRQIPAGIPLLTSILLSVTIVATVFVFLHSGRRPGAWTSGQEIALRGLLAEYGGHDALGYFATRRDKELIFAPDGRAAVAYRVVGSVCLAAGDPVGDPAAWQPAVEAWKRHARGFGWTLGVVGASEEAARVFAAAGLGVLVLGDEAVLYPDQFSLTDRNLADVRRAVRHARRKGLEVRIRRQSDVPPAELAALGELADKWRGSASDRGFSMALNRWGDPADGRCLIVTAHGDDGAVTGLLSMVPWGRNGLSLDLMRRSPEAANGTTELLVARLMEQAKDLGITRISLNFAMFRGLFADADRLGAGAVTRLNTSLLGFFERFFQLERLYRSNAKYRPEWFPRYLCFDGLLVLPRVALAAAQVEGFVPGLWHREAPQYRLTEAELELVGALETAPRRPRGPARRLSAQTRHRLRHAQMLREAGMEPYPVGMAPAVPVASADGGPGQPCLVFGRIRGLRHHGGVLFADLTDGGCTVQAVLERGVLGTERLRLLSRALDVGDLVVVTATEAQSRSGTPSLQVSQLQVAAKALHPVPYVRGPAGPGSRPRHREMDLLVRPAGMDVLVRRARVLGEIRRLLGEEGYREVETPILAAAGGGAAARPFRTYSNAYGTDLTLRIAPELYLKRLLVAGSGRIFEIGRNFRNEGADATHSPEFTSLEAYSPFADYTDMKELAERLVKAAATKVHGAAVMPLRRAQAPGEPPELTDVSGPWAWVKVLDAVSQVLGQRVSADSDPDLLVRLARRNGVAVGPGPGAGTVLEELYARLVEPATVLPTFYYDFPAESTPLAAPHRSSTGLVERWDLVANGMEIGTGYSELTDPLEQRRRLTEQALHAGAGAGGGYGVDEDFLAALETGMPPAGGLGLGIDRLMMLLEGTGIREVLSFPFTKPGAGP